MSEELVQNPNYHLAYSIAVVCHEANRALCTVNNDDSQKPWTETDFWQQQSTINRVLFRIENPEAGHDALHNAWMEDKIKDGWNYGEIKNVDLKLHPCLVPFDQLPEFQQKKHALFSSIVDSILGRVANTVYVVDKDSHLDSLVRLREGRGTFGDAVRLAKEGHRVCRKGWNGKNMCAYFVPAASYPAMSSAAKEIFGEKGMVPYREYWALVTATGEVSTWAPSGSDSLADDWCIIEKVSQ